MPLICTKTQIRLFSFVILFLFFKFLFIYFIIIIIDNKFVVTIHLGENDHVNIIVSNLRKGNRRRFIINDLP